MRKEEISNGVVLPQVIGDFNIANKTFRTSSNLNGENIVQFIKKLNLLCLDRKLYREG